LSEQQAQLPERPWLRLQSLALALLTLAAAFVTFLLPPIAQDPEYHFFADTRPFFGIPNCFDVISNLPFAAVGVAGLIFVIDRDRSRPSFVCRRESWFYILLFLAVVLTSAGSSYYHLAPSNQRLVWDRLPMTMGFMSIFAAVIGERISLRWGIRLLGPLILIGAASVFYWSWGEASGSGDLRFYGLVQYYPLLAIPLIIWMSPACYTRTATLGGALALYGIAKLLEILDSEIFSAGEIVSGHTLKHLAAAAGVWWVLRWLKQRRAVSSEKGLASAS
jgi:hypothetical protein